MLTVKVTGDFKHIYDFLRGSGNLKERRKKIFEKWGRIGVESLAAWTPKDTGKTAASWDFTVGEDRLIFTNNNFNNGVPIVILIQNGHATRQGGYIAGIDFINPALRDIFTNISMECWKEVVNL